MASPQPLTSDPEQRDLVQRTVAHVRQAMTSEGAHDWLHIERVWRNAQAICMTEPDADVAAVELAALLHDIADWKFHNGDLTAGPRAAHAWLISAGAPPALAERVADIVGRVSFKGAAVPDDMPTLEGQ